MLSILCADTELDEVYFYDDPGIEDGSVWVDGASVFEDEVEMDAADQCARGDL